MQYIQKAKKEKEVLLHTIAAETTLISQRVIEKRSLSTESDSEQTFNLKTIVVINKLTIQRAQEKRVLRVHRIASVSAISRTAEPSPLLQVS